MTAMTFALDKAQFDRLAGPPVADQAAILVKIGRRVPAIGETLQLKAGKSALVGMIVATAAITFTPIALRRVLDLKTGGDVGESLGRLITAAEQGAPQAAEHLEKLGALTGFPAWYAAFAFAQIAPDKDDTPLELTRRLIAIAGMKALD